MKLTISDNKTRCAVKFKYSSKIVNGARQVSVSHNQTIFGNLKNSFSVASVLYVCNLKLCVCLVGSFHFTSVPPLPQSLGR